MGVMKWNTADGGTTGVGVTAANSGGSRSGHAWDVVATNAAHIYSTSNTGAPLRGVGLCYITDNVVAYNEWSITALEFWGSGLWCFYPNLIDGGGASSGTTQFLKALGASDVQAARLEYNTVTGKIAIQGRTGTGAATSTGTVGATTSWTRVDWYFKIAAASAGVAQARIYFNPTTAPNTYETITETSLDTLGTMNKLRFGVQNTPAAYLKHEYDDIIIDDRNWVDRRLHPVSRMGRVLSA